MRILGRGGHGALVIATSGHFGGGVGAARLRNGSRWRARAVQVFSVHVPLPELVAWLNRLRPALRGGYASVIALLAGEQEAGRLHTNPALVQPTSEGLAAGKYDRIARAFHARVRTNYVATECLFIAYGRTEGWLHLNSDWVVLEPADGTDPNRVWQAAHTEVMRLLTEQRLGHLTVERAEEPPKQSPDGEYRTVIPLR